MVRHNCTSTVASRRLGLPRWRDHPIERVEGRGFTVLDSRAVDVALRRGDRFVAEQLHQCVDADVGVGEFGGERYLYLVWRKRLLLNISRCRPREARRVRNSAMSLIFESS